MLQPNAPVLLFNHRESKFNETLNSDDNLLNNIKSIAKAKGMAVVIVAVGLEPKKIKDLRVQNYVLDL